MGALIAGSLLLICWLGSAWFGTAAARLIGAPHWVAVRVAQLVGGSAALILVLFAAGSIALGPIVVGLIVALIHASIIAYLMRLHA